MLGIQDFWVALAYGLCIASAVVCAVYGLIMWNREGETPPDPQDVEWAREEKQIDETLG